ncbi:Gfo/Idh/MocA family protein [Bacteroidota bacterium]
MKRRHFIKGTATTVAGASLIPFIPSASRAASRIIGANDRINVGLIGANGMGFNNLKRFLENEGVECKAICDVDQNVLEKRAAETVELQGKKPDLYGDYRKLIDQKNIDVVIIGTPDHWHCLPMVEACQAGKDVYVEKPIANTIQECNLMIKAAHKYERVVQVGQWQRSDPHWQNAVDFIRSGKLGKIRTVKAWAFLGWKGVLPVLDAEQVPDGVDYDFWLGPAPKRPFSSYRFHFNFRWFWDYAGGLMTDWGVHLLDFALYGMDQYVPNSVMSSGGKFAYPDDARETPDTQYAIYDFDGFGLVWESAVGIAGGNYGRGHGVAFLGENGTLVVDRKGWEVIPEKKEGVTLMEAVPLNEKVAGGGLPMHVKNFLECIKTREKPQANIEIGAHIARFAQLGNIAYKTGRKVYWNPEKQMFINDDEANELVNANYRAPWKLPVL